MALFHSGSGTPTGLQRRMLTPGLCGGPKIAQSLGKIFSTILFGRGVDCAKFRGLVYFKRRASEFKLKTP